MAMILALETSCDETAVAILRDGELLASEVASQIAEHEKFGGVVPEVASRNHLVHAPDLLERAVKDANVKMAEIDAFAATSGPGLASSLMIGASIAKGLAIAFNRPYLAINHLEGHLLSPFFGEQVVPRNISLIVSGGHTLTVLVHGVGDYEIIGRTVDDAAGEAFDKVAKMLGLAYPGGPEIEKRAQGGDAARFILPRSMPDSQNFSFSGLKTAVRYLLPKLVVEGEGMSPDRSGTLDTGNIALNPHVLADLCASFQQAIIEVLVRKTMVAARTHKVGVVTVSGGVSCNRALRAQLGEVATRAGLLFKSAESRLCTDNAAMIAFAATQRFERGIFSAVSNEIDPNLALAS
jgi:N6-L-threonylcarbamoyladenine synthase